MALFAIADPHLGFGVSKPMAIFGSQWCDHDLRLEANWRSVVTDEDTVLIPGDISWGMNLAEALPDLQFLNRLPGRKILSRGNHDYWWASLAKMERFCCENGLNSLLFLRNNSLTVEPDWLICGTRGWIVPDDPDYRAGDEKIYLREVGRLQLSLEAAAQIRTSLHKLVVCLHYPPYMRDGSPNLFTALLTEYKVDRCIFGHIHGLAPERRDYDRSCPVRCQLVSADYLGFNPLRL